MDTVHWDRALAENYGEYAKWLKQEIDKMRDATTLPIVNVRREIRARQLAIEKLIPTYEKFLQASKQHGAIADATESGTTREDAMRQMLYDGGWS